MLHVATLLMALAVADNPETIATNNNRTPAGKLSKGVLTLRLEARMGAWYPDGPQGMPRPVAAFAEQGKKLQNPGPVIRARVGAEVRVVIRNSLADSLWIFGLGEKRGVDADSFVIAPGVTQEAKFTATDPGVFYYAGKTTKAPLMVRGGADGQLNGAIIIDAPGANTDDHIFLISWWFSADSTAVGGLGKGSVITLNGLSWPHTERKYATQGEEQRWRFISVTSAPHPMHLHGFYFRIDGKGDGATFKALPPEERQMAVTEVVSAGKTLAISWTAKQPGNWIMHCHLAGHMTSLEGWNKDRRHPDQAHGSAVTKASHDDHFMYGLVTGITVKPKGSMQASTVAARPVRLIIKSKPKVYGEYVGYAYALGGTAEENDPNAMPLPGPTLVLEKDRPVAVTIINRSHESAAVHWHGIELESFPDGVPGVSGYGKNLLPAIPAGDSLTVRFTPPRAGTFMYHSHFNELQQIGSGLYGAIIVVEPGQKYDAEIDRLLVLSDGGPFVSVAGPFPNTLLNGRETPEPMQLKIGTRYRFRMINIRAEADGHLTILDGETPIEWKLIARDGADVPEPQQKVRPAKQNTLPGMIFDYEYTPTKAGELRLRFGYPPRPDGPPLKDVVIRVAE